MDRCGYCDRLLLDLDEEVEFEGERFCSYDCYEGYCEEWGLDP